MFDRGIPVNIDTIPEDLLEDFIGLVHDDTISIKREAFLQAIKFLSEEEFDLLVKRYCLGEAHKTIRRELETGSTRTIFLRLKKLKKILEGYINYFMVADHEVVMETVLRELGEDGYLIVGELFVRVTRSRIRKSNRGVITRSRIVEVCDQLQEIANGNSGVKALCEHVLFRQE